MKLTNHKNKGYVIIFMTMLFMAIIVVLLVGVVNPVISNYASAQSTISSKKSFSLADSATEEALYRLKNSKKIGATQTLTLSSGTATINISNTSTGKKIDANSQAGAYQKNIRVNLAVGTGISFHYGIQAGRGGFELNNSSSITGNVFSSGPVIGSGNIIRGDVVSAGPSGLINGIHATGTAYAHTIQNSTIDKDAYYMAISNTTVGGMSYPNSPDQIEEDLPIPDEQINLWESEAEDGEIKTCSSGTYIIDSDESIGPAKIPCDLLIKGSGIVVMIGGPIWVTGNIETQVSPSIRMDSSLGNQNVAIIADNKSASTTSSIITIGQNTSFQGSGSTNSYVFMVSQNGSAENGGTTDAIYMGQGSSAVVAYAPHGQISLGQSVSVKEATGYKIVLNNTANVIYDTGLASTLFSAGPGGGYNVVDWTEI